MYDGSRNTEHYNAARDLGTALRAQQVSPADADDLARGFLARLQRDIDEQVDARMQQYRAAAPVPGASTRPRRDMSLAAGSLAAGVALTAVVGIFDVGMAVAIIGWICIALVNVASALASPSQP